MIHTRYVITIEVEASSEAESWRLFNEKISNGEGNVETVELSRDLCHTVPPIGRRYTIIPERHDTIVDSATVPCSGII